MFLKVKFKPLPIPAIVPDGKLFGKNDMTTESMMAKRRRAHQLFHDQMSVVEQRKRDAILHRVNDQREEDEMLKRTKSEWVNELLSRYAK